MFKISEQQVQKVANYLGSKPFNEVIGLIQMLQTLPKDQSKPPVIPSKSGIKSENDNKGETK